MNDLPLMRNWLFTIAILWLATVSGWSQGYQIDVELRDTVLSEIYLGYHYADKQYILDTAKHIGDGHYQFTGAEERKPGVYLLVFPPNNLYLEVLLDEGEQKIKFSTETSDLSTQIDVKTKGQTRAFYEYIAFLRKQKKKAAELSATQNNSQDSLAKAQAVAAQKNLDDEVSAYQEKLLEDYEGSMLDLVISSGLQVQMPEFAGLSGNQKRQAQYRYYKEHYWDHVDLSDDRLIRTPFIQSKVDAYMSNLTPQVPDSIAASLDYLFSRMDPDGDLYRHYMVKYVNEYSASKVVGMDAVFVHLAENYYRTGKAHWTPEENLSKILKRSSTLQPILLGKTAPDFTFVQPGDSTHTLYEVESPYTILIFWDPDCGVCKKAMPEAVAFGKKYRDYGVQIVGICTKRKKDVEDCWSDIAEKGLDNWIVGYDPRGLYKPLYDVTATPMIYVLDEDKVILSKRIAASQLEEVMDIFLDESPNDMQR